MDFRVKNQLFNTFVDYPLRKPELDHLATPAAQAKLQMPPIQAVVKIYFV